MGFGTDALSVVEAAYRVDDDDATWLRGVAEAAYAQVGAGLGILAFEYALGSDGKIRIGGDVQLDMPAAVGATFRSSLEQLPPEFVAKSFNRCEAATASQASDPEMRKINGPMFEAMGAAFGWYDSMMLGGVDPSGQGVYVGSWLPKPTKLTPRERATWSRVAVHIIAGRRLRRRLAAEPGDADAVLRTNGHADHLGAEAQTTEARSSLRQAVLDFERARGRLRRQDPDEAIHVWKGLVAGRWSLVDSLEAGGRRYVLARRNDVPVGGFESLTVRERQAVGHAALGHSNKLIAYEMGISDSTVGVLLHRAARRLNASNRADLIARFLAAAPK